MVPKQLPIGSLYTYVMGCKCGIAFKVTHKSREGCISTHLGKTFHGVECPNQRLVNCFGDPRKPVEDNAVPIVWIGNIIQPIETVEEARKYKGV